MQRGLWRMKRARSDRNTPEIVAAVHACGWQWLDTHSLGASGLDWSSGFPDGLAVHQEDDATWRLILVEVKMPGEKLTAAERRFHERFPGLAKIWRCTEDVIRDVRGGMA